MTDSSLLIFFQKKGVRSDAPFHNDKQQPISSSVVLVIENHDDTRLLLKTIIERRGYLVAEATDGEQVLELFENDRLDLILPNLVLTETVLPGLDGLAVIGKLRMLEMLAKVPVVFLSSRAEQSFKAKASELGCSDFLTKPIELKFLEQTLDKYLERNHTRAQDQTDRSSLNHDGAVF